MLSKGDVVYYARIMPTVGIYEVLELKLRTIEETFFVGTEKSTKHAYLFGNSALNKMIFHNRKSALNLVKEAEKNKIEISKETYYEEDWGE